MGERTVCPFCALQCGIEFGTENAGPDTKMKGVETDPISHGHLCLKGVTAADLWRHPGRLTAPLWRNGTEWTLLDWPTALDRIASRLTEIQVRHGTHAIGFLGSGALTNETAYLLGKFCRAVVGSREIDYNGRYCMSAAARAYVSAFGLDRPTATLADVAETDLLLIAGSNLSEAHPMAMQAIHAAKRRGATIIVVDPRRTRLARLAHQHLPIRPGTDGLLAWALFQTVIEERLVDTAFVDDRTHGYADAAAQAARYSPEAVADATDIDPALIRSIARQFATAKRAMLLHARGIEQYRHGVETVGAFLNLVLATGQVGRPGTGAMMLTGQANGQGGREMGQKNDQLPGSRRIDNPADRQAIARVWGIDADRLPERGSYTASQMFSAIRDGHIRALVVVGNNPVLSAPDTQFVAEALEALDFLVVLDPIMTETARLADAVLPAGGFGVTEGTITNIEARVVPVRSLTPLSSDGPQPDWWILTRLAERLGGADMFPYTDVSQVYDELREATRGAPSDYFGITPERLAAGEALHWPCPDPGHPGEMRLYREAFAHPDGRARFSALPPGTALHNPDSEFPYHLVTGRHIMHYNSGSQTREMLRLGGYATDEIEVHPSLAAELKLTAGQRVTVQNPQGAIEVTVRLTEAIRPDTLFVSMHGTDHAAVNRLISSSPLSLSGMPEFKHTAVRVEPALAVGDLLPTDPAYGVLDAR